MRVSVVRGGGIGGLVTTTTLDSADLDADAAEHLATLVGGCVLSDRPATGRPDGVRVEVSVADGATTARARFDDHDPPEGTRDLVRWVLDHPAARRSVGR